jgi:hypothetical protein
MAVGLVIDVWRNGRSKTCTAAIGILLADPAHAEWGLNGQGVRALAEMPRETPSPEGLTARPPERPVQAPGNGSGVAESPSAVLRGATIQPWGGMSSSVKPDRTWVLGELLHGLKGHSTREPAGWTARSRSKLFLTV